MKLDQLSVWLNWGKVAGYISNQIIRFSSAEQPAPGVSKSYGRYHVATWYGTCIKLHQTSGVIGTDGPLRWLLKRRLWKETQVCSKSQ